MKTCPVFSCLPQIFHNIWLHSEFSAHIWQPRYPSLAEHCFRKLNPCSFSNVKCNLPLFLDRRISLFCIESKHVGKHLQIISVTDIMCSYAHGSFFHWHSHSWKTVDGYIWSEQTIWSNPDRCSAPSQMWCNPTAQRGKTSLVSVELMPVTVELALRESGSLFRSSGAYAPKFTTEPHCAWLVYLWDSSNILS